MDKQSDLSFDDDEFEQLASQHTGVPPLEIPEIDEERIKWDLKGESEVYIEKLEAKLRKAKANYRPPIPPQEQVQIINDPQDTPLLSSEETEDDETGEIIERGITQRFYDTKSGNILASNDDIDEDDSTQGESEEDVSEDEKSEPDNEDENKYMPVSSQNPFEAEEYDEEAYVSNSIEKDDFEADFEADFPDEEETIQKNKVISDTMKSFSLDAPTWVEDEDISKLVARLKN
jgi:hypothetical protein